MPFALLLGLGAAGSLIGGIGSAVGASQQVAEEKQALDFQKQVWQQTQQNLAPFIGAGPSSIANLQAGVGTPSQPGPWTQPFDWNQIVSNPGYKFILGQGEQAITDTSSATGGIGGGNTLKALTNYGQGAAAQYGNMLFGENLATQQNASGLALNIASLAENAAADQGSLGVNTGANIADTLGQIGNAQAGVTGSITGGLQGLLQNYMLGQLLGGGGGFGGFGGVQAGASDAAMGPGFTNAGDLSAALFG